MYNEKEIQAEVDLYQRIHSLRRVPVILGYPAKNTLKKWLKCLKTTGSIKSLTVSKKRKYSEEQILKAVNYFLTQGVSREQAVETSAILPERCYQSGFKDMRHKS